MREQTVKNEKQSNNVKTKRKKYWNIITIVMLLVIIITSMPSYNVEAKEKAYKPITTWYMGWTINGYEFTWQVKGGPTTLFVKKGKKEKKLVTNSDLGLSIVTNGNKVYYFTYHYKTQKATVYKICVDGTKKTKVFSVKAKDGFELAGLVGGKLYYLTGSDHGNLHSYTLKSKKDKVVVKDIFASRYKSKYFILETLCDDEANVSKISSYSIKNKKLKSISTNVCAYQIIGKKLYYVEYKSTRKNISSDEISNVTVKKCSLNGKNKKTLIKKLTIQNIREVTAHAITYTNKEGKEVKKKY